MAKKKKKNGKGQGSTEYLVALAAILVIAIIVIGLLGGFTGFAPSTTIEQSQSYWQGATPFSIEEAQIAAQNSS